MATSPQSTSPVRLAPIAINSRVVGLARAERAAPGITLSPARLLGCAVLVALDFVMVNLAFYLAWYARYRLGLFVALDPGNYVEHEVYIPLQVALAVVFVSLLGLRGLYRLPRAAGALDDLSTIFTVSGLSVMILFAGSTFVRYPAESRRSHARRWG